MVNQNALLSNYRKLPHLLLSQKTLDSLHACHLFLVTWDWVKWSFQRWSILDFRTVNKIIRWTEEETLVGTVVNAAFSLVLQDTEAGTHLPLLWHRFWHTRDKAVTRRKAVQTKKLLIILGFLSKCGFWDALSLFHKNTKRGDGCFLIPRGLSHFMVLWQPSFSKPSPPPLSPRPHF